MLERIAARNTLMILIGKKVNVIGAEGKDFL